MRHKRGIRIMKIMLYIQIFNAKIFYKNIVYDNIEAQFGKI